MAKLSRECVRKGSHVQEDAEKAGEIIKWKELVKKDSALVGGRFRDCEICTISYGLVLQCSVLVHKIWHDVSPCDIHCYGRLCLWSLAAEKRRGVTQMTTHCLEFLHLGDIMELLTN